jgi:hypothetical protein
MLAAPPPASGCVSLPVASLDLIELLNADRFGLLEILKTPEGHQREFLGGTCRIAG